MQRKYIENINSDALMVACISTLDRHPMPPQNQLQAKFDALRTANDNWLAYRVEVNSRAPTTVDPSGKVTSTSLDATQLALAQTEELRLKGEVLKAAQGLATEARTAPVSPLASYCLSGLLPQVMGGYQDILAILKSRSHTLHDMNSLEEALTVLQDVSGKLNELKATLTTEKKPGG